MKKKPMIAGRIVKPEQNFQAELIGKSRVERSSGIKRHQAAVRQQLMAPRHAAMSA
jgi:hypothetical protein